MALLLVELDFTLSTSAILAVQIGCDILWVYRAASATRRLWLHPPTLAWRTLFSAAHALPARTALYPVQHAQRAGTSLGTVFWGGSVVLRA